MGYWLGYWQKQKPDDKAIGKGQRIKPPEVL